MYMSHEMSVAFPEITSSLHQKFVLRKVRTHHTSRWFVSVASFGCIRVEIFQCPPQNTAGSSFSFSTSTDDLSISVFFGLQIVLHCTALRTVLAHLFSCNERTFEECTVLAKWNTQSMRCARLAVLRSTQPQAYRIADVPTR